jgi:hypothetical protein
MLGEKYSNSVICLPYPYPKKRDILIAKNRVILLGNLNLKNTLPPFMLKLLEVPLQNNL